jgi:cation diffusion facilitator family transporter
MHTINIEKAIEEKKRVAFWSVLAAVFITGGKMVVGIITGSLGILSEALHSGLDFVAAAITYFTVRVSDKPADENHPFGHGKYENLSAFIQTILLFITCIWIIYEAIQRFIDVKPIEVNHWSYIVVIGSIIIDYTRSRALKKAAKKHNSQALEADALHFSTDIWSSFVVLIGLITANFGWFWADSAAALIVAFIVIVVAYKLGKRSIDVLLDRTSVESRQKVIEIISGIPQVLDYHNLKIRTSGAYTFVEVNIHLDSKLTIEEAHDISHKVETLICENIEKCKVHVHEEPNNSH